MTRTEKPSVFISHSAHDADWARLFAQALQQRGVTVWIDDLDVRAGESLRDALESGLRGSDVLVALMDPEYPAKPNLFFEVGAAIGMGKRVVSILPKGVDPNNFSDIGMRGYLIRDSPDRTAEELSNSLLAA
jgi:TIR domain